MKSYEIYTKLKKVEENDVTKLIGVWNERCEDWGYYDDIVRPNDIETLKMLLPSDAEEAFELGRITGYSYNYNDEWLSLDGYGRPVSCDTDKLTDKFIMLADLARYLKEAKDDDELQDLWEALDVADDEEDDEEEEEE